MTAIQLNRLIDILDRAVKVAERWADREYPQIDEATQAEIERFGEGSNRTPQTPEEYKDFEAQPSALEKKLRNLA